jgi:hypothetical protein
VVPPSKQRGYDLDGYEEYALIGAPSPHLRLSLFNSPLIHNNINILIYMCRSEAYDG